MLKCLSYQTEKREKKYWHEKAKQYDSWQTPDAALSHCFSTGVNTLTAVETLMIHIYVSNIQTEWNICSLWAEIFSQLLPAAFNWI